MNINTDAIDDVALALLYLTLHDRYRAWKGFDWDVLNRLYERGFIEDPVNKTKSVIFTEEGLRESERLFNQHFVIPERPGNRFNELLTHDTSQQFRRNSQHVGLVFDEQDRLNLRARRHILACCRLRDRQI